MSQMPENVCQVLHQLLPAYIINDIQCYVFYDNHPRDDKNIDIAVYTKSGEVREYFQRDLLSNVDLDTRVIYNEMKILRNSRCELFYLLAGCDELAIISRKDKLQIHQRICDVVCYDINDAACSGEAVLKIILQHSELPLIPDDNFENFKPIDFDAVKKSSVDGPAATHLKTKLTEVKYSVISFQNTHKDFQTFRHNLTYSMYKKAHPNLDESVFKDGLEGIANALKIHTSKPWIKVCNRKLVIVQNLCNENLEPLDDVQILFHASSRESVEYTTKIFEKTCFPPFWTEVQSQMLSPGVESALVVVIDMEELKDNILSRIELYGVIVYMKYGKEGLLPMETIMLSTLDTMSEEFDVMASDMTDTNNMLAVLSTTEKTDLILRHINTANEHAIRYSDMFCQYLQMERVANSVNVVIHRKSPYHILNGVMVLFDTGDTVRQAVSVYSRSSSQVLALIHHIQDVIPFRTLITTSNYNITAKDATLSMYNENKTALEPRFSCINYTTSMINRTRIVLKYLDDSMMRMNESKNPVVVNKIGSEIDLFAQGERSYQEFKEKMCEEAAKGIKALDLSVDDISDDNMCLD